VLLAVVPWYVLGRRWIWWPAGILGAIVGAIIAGIVTWYFFSHLCLFQCGPRQTTLLESVVVYIVLLGMMAAGQALTLPGLSQKFSWVLAGGAAGLVFGVLLQLGSGMIHVDPSTMPIGPSIAAGAGAGAVFGVVSWLMSRRLGTRR
jgi:hypothetical protein